VSQSARATDEARIVRIADGVMAEVVPLLLLHRRLDILLARLAVVKRWPVTILGTRRACTDLEHDWTLWLRGFDKGADRALIASSRHGIVDLLLSVCRYCRAVEVRDRSFDVLDPSLPMGRGGPRRRDDILGRYAGSRPGGRQYL
jgi:hypothetical protein